MVSKPRICSHSAVHSLSGLAVRNGRRPRPIPSMRDGGLEPSKIASPLVARVGRNNPTPRGSGVGSGSLQALRRPATLGRNLGPNRAARVHRVVLFEADDEMISQRSHGRRKPTFRGEHQINAAGLLAPVQEEVLPAPRCRALLSSERSLELIICNRRVGPASSLQTTVRSRSLRAGEHQIPAR